LMLGYGEDCSQWTSAQDHIVLSADQVATPEWIEKSFTISEANQLALIALQFDNAANLDINIGEVSIRRAEYAAPDTPTVTSATLLAAHKDGLDAKVIFDLNLAEGNRQGHYNIDHNASLYKIYARINYAESEETTLMGATTSWAALFFSAPYDPVKAKAEGATLSVGVSAVSLDMQSESNIAWSEPMTIDFDAETYIVNDDIEASDTFITDAEQFSIGFKDPLHVPAEGWKLIGPHNNASFETPIELAIDGCHSFKASADIDAETVSLDALPYGTYDIEAYDAEGNVRRLHSAIHIYSDMAVAEPVISSFHPVDTDGDDDAISEVTEEMTTAALDENADYLVVNNDGTLSDLKATHTTLPGTGMKLRPADTLTMQYTAESGAIGTVSRGVNLRGYSLGIPAGQAGVQADIETIEEGEGWEKVTIDESDLKFSVAFWVKFTDLSDPTWLLNIRNPKDAWPYSDWGWLWGTISDDGYLNNISIRSHHNNTFVYDFTDDNGKGKVKFEENAWYHVAYVFDEYKTTESSYYGIITDSERNFSLYVNGQLITPKSVTEPKDKAWKDFDPNAIIAVGGTAGVGSFAGYDAVIDNLQFYNVALDADAIASTMGDIDASNPPAGMTALWDFEGDDIYRNALSTYPEAELNHAFSTHSTSMDEIVTVGYPALRGSKAQPTTLIPTLTAADAYATTSDITIDDQGVAHGSAELRFPSLENGTYRIYTPQLTLDNSIGNDQAEYAYIYVVNLDGKINTGIVGVNADDVAFDVYPNPFSRVLNVAIEKGGEYTLQLVNLEGKVLASKTCEVADKGVLSLDADVDKGVCIAVLLKDKTVVATKKLIKE
ncbi:MAG: T9SS type A sorting domain-containing protein, partial [Muribaculaceae bacterium]|nr:T9SS type A sorting domain-containing protein [Muribaculaceae bacterium]